jgi:cyclophilin family peptidyl-prolyl cis-trans isomerase
MTSALAGTYVQFRTVMGDVEVELYDQDKPVTTQNFLRFVQGGLYNGMFLHRLAPGFVAQGGGFVTTNRVDSPILSIPNYGPITNEYNVGRRFSNVYGTLAMARVGGVTNSATSQWFLNLANNTFLDGVDGGFTVFGHVVGGSNVLVALNAFRTGAASNGVYDARNALQDGTFGELPLFYPFLAYTNLLYVDISTLNVKVQPVSGGREISWNSVSNRINHVEFTTHMPPQWQSIVSTNGHGQTLRVMDPSTDPKRFYRVRIDY